MTPTKFSVFSYACLLWLAGSAMTAQAAIFSEDFNSFVGNQNNTQMDTGLNVAFSGSVAGWTNGGSGTMHAVDLDNSAGTDWAVMFWTDNTITSSLISGANATGTNYALDFDYGSAVYACCGQDSTAAEGLVVQILRSNDTVLATQTYMPGAWMAGNYNLDAGLHGTLNYVGDGSGDVKIYVQTLNQAANRFGGELDNISLDVASVPEPCSSTLAAFGAVGTLLLVRRSRLRRTA